MAERGEDGDLRGRDGDVQTLRCRVARRDARGRAAKGGTGRGDWGRVSLRDESRSSGTPPSLVIFRDFGRRLGPTLHYRCTPGSPSELLRLPAPPAGPPAKHSGEGTLNAFNFRNRPSFPLVGVVCNLADAKFAPSISVEIPVSSMRPSIVTEGRAVPESVPAETMYQVRRAAVPRLVHHSDVSGARGSNKYLSSVQKGGTATCRPLAATRQIPLCGWAVKYRYFQVPSKLRAPHPFSAHSLRSVLTVEEDAHERSSRPLPSPLCSAVANDQNLKKTCSRGLALCWTASPSLPCIPPYTRVPKPLCPRSLGSHTICRGTEKRRSAPEKASGRVTWMVIHGEYLLWDQRSRAVTAWPAMAFCTNAAVFPTLGRIRFLAPLSNGNELPRSHQRLASSDRRNPGFYQGLPTWLSERRSRTVKGPARNGAGPLGSSGQPGARRGLLPAVPSQPQAERVRERERERGRN